MAADLGDRLQEGSADGSFLQHGPMAIVRRRRMNNQKDIPQEAAANCKEAAYQSPVVGRGLRLELEGGIPQSGNLAPPLKAPFGPTLPSWCRAPKETVLTPRGARRLECHRQTSCGNKSRMRYVKHCERLACK